MALRSVDGKEACQRRRTSTKADHPHSTFRSLMRREKAISLYSGRVKPVLLEHERNRSATRMTFDTTMVTQPSALNQNPSSLHPISSVVPMYINGNPSAFGEVVGLSTMVIVVEDEARAGLTGLVARRGEHV